MVPYRSHWNHRPEWLEPTIRTGWFFAPEYSFRSNAVEKPKISISIRHSTSLSFLALIVISTQSPFHYYRLLHSDFTSTSKTFPDLLSVGCLTSRCRSDDFYEIYMKRTTCALKGEAIMHCLMYNLKRVLKLRGPKNLIESIKDGNDIFCLGFVVFLFFNS